MPQFGPKSLAQLATCSPNLQKVLNVVIKSHDFVVLKGHRGQAEQHEAFLSGHSKLDWPHGNHNKLPSTAVDVAPYHPDFGALIGTKEQIKKISAKLNKTTDWVDGMIREHYCHLAGRLQGAAEALGFKLRWGADWDKDNDLFDNSFDDLGHLEETT